MKSQRMMARLVLASSILLGLSVGTAKADASCTSNCNLTVTAICGNTVQTSSGCAATLCAVIGEQCNCASNCTSAKLLTTCSCKQVISPRGFPATFRVVRYGASFTWMFTLPVETPETLERFGALLEDVTGWGVVIVNNPDHQVGAGEWTGSLDDIVSQIAATNGIAVTWDDANGIISLGVN